jgi:thioesterase domain-containing protein
VAYWSGEETAAGTLRRALAERLPDYMLPAAFVYLDALPLTENGKIDRNALPEPEAAGAIPTGRVPPRDALERFLASQFHEVLVLPAAQEVGTKEDFFELGGTSISSAIFIHRLQEALGEIVHVVTIFDHPTVAGLAQHLRELHPQAVRRLGDALAPPSASAAASLQAAAAESDRQRAEAGEPRGAAPRGGALPADAERRAAAGNLATGAERRAAAGDLAAGDSGAPRPTPATAAHGGAVRPGAPLRDVLVPLQAGDAGRAPLFCVHSVGGEVVSYRELAHLLGAGQPVWGLQSPDPPPAEVPEMAARYVAALRGVQPHGPYRIAGWSMGGIVAYEMARQLEAAGETTSVLAIIDAASPARWTGEAERSDAAMVVLFATALEQVHAGDVEMPAGFELPADGLDTLDADAALAIALDLGRRTGLLPVNLELAELRRLFERFRTNRRSLATYSAQPYGGVLHLFRAAGADPDQDREGEMGAIRRDDGDGEASAREAGARRRRRDPTLGWGALVNGGLRIFDVPGDHRTILKRGVAAVAEHLRGLL